MTSYKDTNCQESSCINPCSQGDNYSQPGQSHTVFHIWTPQRGKKAVFKCFNPTSMSIYSIPRLAPTLQTHKALNQAFLLYLVVGREVSKFSLSLLNFWKCLCTLIPRRGHRNLWFCLWFLQAEMTQHIKSTLANFTDPMVMLLFQNFFHWPTVQPLCSTPSCSTAGGCCDLKAGPNTSFFWTSVHQSSLPRSLCRALPPNLCPPANWQRGHLILLSRGSYRH